MRSRFVNLFVLTAITFLGVSNAFSQVQFHGLLCNPKLNTKQNALLARQILTNDTLNLPFFEDFSKLNTYPDYNQWIDSNVFVNQNFAFNPPSAGVATFDILNSKGQIYSHASTAAYRADYLTSKPIRMSAYQKSDSIYFSFYYQPQGMGWDKPDQKDSLVLEFFDKANQWRNVWSATGTSLKPFEQVMFPIVDSVYFHSGFKFRFYNYASLGDPAHQEDAITNDFWNIDYIVIDTGRSLNRTYHEDIAFYQFNRSLFETYYSVPWSHYQLNKMPLDTVDFQLKNLDDNLRPVNNLVYLLYRNQTNMLDSFANGAFDVLAFSDSSKYFTQAAMSTPSVYHIPSTLTDTTTLEVTRYLHDLSSFTNTQYKQNDTVKYQQVFENYYAFDDGTAESGISLIQRNSKFALRITGLKDDTLRAISMYFNRYYNFNTSDEAEFSLCVWTDNEGIPGELIYQGDVQKPKYASNTNQFSVFKLDEAVFVEDTFFIGWNNENDLTYSLAYDWNSDNINRVYYKISGEWLVLPLGNPMMRAHLGDDFTVISVPENPNKIAYKIFPNPSNGTVYIQTETHQEIVVSVFNLVGQNVFCSGVESNNAIDLSQLPKGVYLMQIQSGQTFSTQKLILE